MVSIVELTKKISAIARTTGVTIFEGQFTNNKKGTFFVVNPLALVGTKIQTAIVNVNLYTDNLKLNIDGKNDQSQPDYKEQQRILNLVLPLIQDNDWKDNELIRIDSSGVIYEETQTIINIRVEYTQYNY